MENLLALSIMHQRAPVEVVRCVQTSWSADFHVFLSPSFAWENFEGGGAKPWYLTALEATPEIPLQQ
jgi:hypothetical protein